MDVDDDGVGGALERTGRKLALDRRERIVERLHEDAAHDVDDQHARAVPGVDQGRAAAGRAGGKLIGRSSFGARSMKTSASFWSQE